MAKKSAAVDFVLKIKKIIDIATDDASQNFTLIRKVVHKTDSNFNQAKKKTQSVEGKETEGATDQSVTVSQKTHVTSEQEKKGTSKSSENPNGEKVESVEETGTTGCPVSNATGEELLQLEDANLPGHLPFVFSRTYRSSACELNIGLGFGWSHSLSHTLEVNDDVLIWTDAEHKKTTLDKPTKTRPELYNKLAKAAAFLGDQADEYILVQADQSFHHFTVQSNGKYLLSAISDQYGNKLEVHYDANQRLNYIVNEQGVALWFVYKNGLISQVEYRVRRKETYETWHLERVCQRYTYNDQSQLIEQRNPLNEGESYLYDELNVISLRKMAGGVEFGWKWEGEGKSVRCVHHWSNTGYDTQFNWGEDGSVEVQYSDGSSSLYQHDENAKLVKVVDPDGAETQHQYDKEGNLTVTTDALGNETQHIYNQYDQRVATVQPDGAVIEYQYWRGNLRRVIQSDRNWRYKYNRQGDIREKRDPLGRDTFYKYNDQGKLTRIQHPDGSVHKLEWNRLGMLIGETYPDGSQASYRYDIFGRIITEKAPSGAITQYSWDDSDRLASTKLPNGGTKHYQYNAYGKPTSIIDEHGLETRYEYHPNTHLVSKVINPDGSALRYRYDNVKNFVSEIINEKDEQYTIEYYSNGLVRQEATFDGRGFYYEYDLTGHLTKKVEIGTEGTELETQFERDSMGRLISKTLPDGSGIEYTYNQFGELVSADDGETPLAWQYDLFGRLIEEHQGWASQYYQYDALGNLTSWQMPDANKLRYEYSHGGVLKRLVLNETPITSHRFEHGLETRRTQGQILSQFEHDEQGRLTAHTQLQNDNITQQRSYSYSKSGELLSMSDSRYGTVEYNYDPLARLRLTHGAVEEHFNHDPAGNLLKQTLGSISQKDDSHVVGNQLKFQGDCHYEYDEFGRMVSERRGKNQTIETLYHYDGQHRLIQVEFPNGSVANYKYDAFGRRVEKQVVTDSGSAKTEFVWQGDKLIAESGDSAYQSYIYELGSFKPLALVQGEGVDSQVYYYHLDQIGTPTDITNARGQSVWSVQYRAYGNVLKQHVKEVENPLRFQGQYYDAETGLHYNRHRYYSPNSGRFITADPIGLAGGLNNYQYVVNPTGWVDPLGLSDKKGSCPGGKGSEIGLTGNGEVDSAPSIDTNGGLDWESVVPKKGKYKGQSREEHVRLHNVDNVAKPNHGVFYGDGVDITNKAWSRAKDLDIKPDADGNLFVPMNATLTGRAGGQAADSGELFYGVHIKLVPGTNKIITSYPGN